MNHFTTYSNTRTLMTALLLISLSLTACKKLIEIPPSPPDKVSTERVYSDSANAMGALLGLYGTFQSSGFLSHINGGTVSVYTAISADELLPTSSSAEVDALYNNNLRSDSYLIGEMWTSAYQGIYQTNAVLEGVTDNAKLSATFQRQARGEALLTRALYYFNLVNIFGKVPIVKTTDYRTNAVLPRASVDAVYAFITADLTNAVSLLTDKYPSAGRLRPNINAARALLAKVYLYRGQWKEASDMAGLVINSGLYDLVEPNKVFIDGSREAIWQVATLTQWGQTAEASSLLAPNATTIPTYAITDYLNNAFEPDDKRKGQWTGTSTVAGLPYHYSAKYKNTTAGVTPIEHYMIFRLGEQLLVRAEALAQQNLLDESRLELNKVRTRAGLGNTPAVSKEEVLAAIAKERQVELFVEWGHRWFDLKRTGKANEVLGARKTDWKSTDVLYPVPQSELNTNPFLDQNEAY